MKRVLILMILLLPNVIFALPLPIDVTADAVILVNSDNNEIMYEKNTDKEEILASLTKMMTVYTAVNNIKDFNKKVKIQPKHLAHLSGFTQVGLKVGETVTYNDLLYATILYSGADAAQTLAYEVGGTLENFNKMVNKDVEAMGLKHTHLKDSFGGSDYNVSTPRELAIFINNAIKNEKFKKVYSADKYSFNGRTIYNYTGITARNYGFDPGVITGNKSGFTPEAGLLLASTAIVNNSNYILVVCKSNVDKNYSTHVKDSYKVLNYVRNHHYEDRIILKKGDVIKRIQVDNSTINEYVVTIDNNVIKYLSDEEASRLKYDYHVTNLLTSSNRKGDNLGYIDVLIDGNIIYTYNVILKDNIYSLEEKSKNIVIISAILAFIILVILVCNLFSRRR